MNAGKLRHKLTIEAPTESRDSAGGVTYSWATLDTVWGEIISLSGTELVNAQAIHPEVNHKITIRYRSSVTSENRITWYGRTFEVVSVLNPEQRNIYLTLMCKERTEL